MLLADSGVLLEFLLNNILFASTMYDPSDKNTVILRLVVDEVVPEADNRPNPKSSQLHRRIEQKRTDIWRTRQHRKRFLGSIEKAQRRIRIIVGNIQSDIADILIGLRRLFFCFYPSCSLSRAFLQLLLNIFTQPLPILRSHRRWRSAV